MIEKGFFITARPGIMMPGEFLHHSSFSFFITVLPNTPSPLKEFP